MNIPREEVYGALFALLETLRAPGATDGFPDGDGPNEASPGTPTPDQPFNLVSREVIEVQRVPPPLQPVLFMDEVLEDNEFDGEGLVGRKWQVLLHIGVTSERGTPAAPLLNPLIDCVEAVLYPTDGSDVLTLKDDNGKPRVGHVQIKGTAVKNLSQNSTAGFRQASYYLPLEIALPGTSNR